MPTFAIHTHKPRTRHPTFQHTHTHPGPDIQPPNTHTHTNTYQGQTSNLPALTSRCLPGSRKRKPLQECLRDPIEKATCTCAAKQILLFIFTKIGMSLLGLQFQHLKITEWQGKCRFLGNPLLSTLCFQCWGLVSIPGWGTKRLQAIWHGQKIITTENSLAVQCLTVVQWLGLCAFTVEGAVSIPGWGIKFL